VIDRAVAAIEAGQPVVLPTDTVYGLCADPENRAAAREAYRLKGREARQPTALLARDVMLVLSEQAAGLTSDRKAEARAAVERMKSLYGYCDDCAHDTA